MLRLHDYRRCPFCIRVRMVIVLKALDCEIVPETLRDWSEWMQSWSVKNNTRARVPVLENPETGWTLAESNEITLWLDALPSSHHALTPEKSKLSEMRSWWRWCDERLKPAIDLYKYGPSRILDPSLTPAHEQSLTKLLHNCEHALSNQPYLLGKNLTLADIAIIPFIRQLMRTREGAFDFSPFPQLTRWAEGVLSADWFTDKVMRKISQ